MLVGIVGSVIWSAAKLITFLQPILIPVAIAAILAYLLDPVVTRLVERQISRGKAIALLFAIAFLALAAFLAWLVPTVSLQGANVARELPNYTNKARDQFVELIYRYNLTFGAPAAERTKPASPAKSFVDWLLASPRQTPTPTPAAEPGPESLELSAQPTPPREMIGPPPSKLSSAERQRIQEWVEKQLPNLQSQIPTLVDKLWTLLKTSIGDFLGITGFLLSLVMVPIYLFFLLKERPAI